MARSSKSLALAFAMMAAVSLSAQQKEHSGTDRGHDGPKASATPPSGGSGHFSHAPHFSPGPSTGPAPTPFDHNIHIQTNGYSCYGCNAGYGYYGGYYSPYGNDYSTTVPVSAIPTATDLILANGGTFNSADSSQSNYAAQSQQVQSQAAPALSYSQVPRQGTDNTAYVNSPVPTGVVSAAADSPAILVFRDGTQLTVQNYAIYGSNLIILETVRRKIPIASLNIAATQKANEQAGYELHLPAVFTSN